MARGDQGDERAESLSRPLDFDVGKNSPGMTAQTLHGTPPIELIERAVHDLRRLPRAGHLAFLVGTVPFILGLLWFWADMSRGAFADRRCAGAALGLALLYLWMKTWHAVYCSAIQASLAGAPPRSWTLRRWWRTLAVQAAIQPWGFLLIPVSVVALLLPFPWVFAFFHQATALADDSDGAAGRAIGSAVGEAKRWPGQNHALQSLLLLATLVVILNVTVVLSQLPALLKLLTGVESELTLSAAALIFNGTFIISVLAVSYLVLMPLVLAVYTRRSFEGKSLHSGADLRGQLRSLRPVTNALHLTAWVLAFWCVLSPMTTAVGADVNSDNAAAPVRPSKLAAAPALDRAIGEVLNRPEFTWRERRELGANEEVVPQPGANALERFVYWLKRQLNHLAELAKSPLQALGRSVQSILQWIQSLLGGPSTPSPRGDDEVDWMTGIKLALYGGLVVAVVALGWYGARLWRRRRSGKSPVAPTPATAAVPDLLAEHVSAAALPEEGWLQLAREFAGRGEFRPAIRAVYLAELAHLARRDLVRLGEAKSNRDYFRELERRARTLPAARDAFLATAEAFDRVWYGSHTATADLLAVSEAHFAELSSAT